MQSENQHIDDFIRSKEAEAAASDVGVQQHWLEMKKLLQPAILPAKPSVSNLIFRYAAIAVPAILLIAVLINNNKKKENAIAPVAEATPIKTIKVKIGDSVERFEDTFTYNVNYKVQESKEKKIKSGIAIPATDTIENNFALIQTDTIEKVLSNKEAFEFFYNSIDKKSEVFAINTEKDTTIQCAEGTTIFIPANSFETANGERPDKIAEITVKEFYALSDIIGNKLTTLSNNRMLETGGMIHMQAKAGNQSLKIKRGAHLDMQMPTQRFDPYMRLFSGEAITTASKVDIIQSGNEFTDSIQNSSWGRQGSINWMDRGQPQAFMKEDFKIITLFNLRDNPISTKNYKNGTKTKAAFKIPYNSPVSKAEVKLLLEEKFGKYYDKIVVTRESKSLFRSAKREKANGIPRHEWYETNYVGDSITIPIKYAVRLKYITREDSIAYENKWREQLIARQKNEALYREYLEMRKSYSFRIENMGWINCDKFLNYPPSRLTDLYVGIENGFENSFFSSILIFKKRNVAIAGYTQNGKIQFGKIPAGEEITIISVGAKEGKMYASIQNTVARKGSSEQLKFEKISPEDFKQKMSAFGSVATRN